MTLSELQKQAGHHGDVLDLPLLECMVAVLCSAAEAGGELRRDMMTAQLNKTVAAVIHRLTALLSPSSASSSVTATTAVSLRRLLTLLDELLSVYGASLRSFSSRLQPLLTSLLLYCDDTCLPPLLNSLTTLLVSVTAAAVSQQSNKAKQARMQQAAQDTTDEVAQQKLAATTASACSPYHTFAAACLREMTAMVDELRAAVGEQPLMGGGVRGVSVGLGWEAVAGEGVMRSLQIVRRYERLCAVMATLVAPQLPAAVASSSVELSVPLLPLLHVLCGALGVEQYASSGSSMTETALAPSAALFVLPSLYDSSLRLLDMLLRQCHHAMPPFVYPLSSLLVDVHRRCSTTPSFEHLLLAVYRTLASFFRLPLSPSLLALLSGNFLSSLLAHVQQPFVLRRELTMQQVSQSMAAQLKPATAHNKRTAYTSGTSAASASSELVGEQQAVREAVAAGALVCLHGMLEAGSLFPLAARTTIDSTLLVLAMSLTSSTSHSSLPLPVTIRLPLYRCLIAALMYPPAASPSAFTSPLLPYALPVLARGARRADGEEGSVCRDGLLLCEWLTRERAGVTIGKRRKADRLFDRKEDEEGDGESHVLDGLDEWRGDIDGGRGRAANGGGELSGGSKKRRADEDVERKEGRAVVSSLFAREQKESVQLMDEVEDEEDESKLEAVQQSREVQLLHPEQKEAPGGDSTEPSDAEEEVEAEDEQYHDEGEVEEEEKEAGSDDRVTVTASAMSLGDVGADDDEFGAVLRVDDESDEG